MDPLIMSIILIVLVILSDAIISILNVCLGITVFVLNLFKRVSK